ncbi:unnamed protein product [Echinostoma caproni]|uniref:ANK_REP_REGION domain-containing protein n=1 Tax=Echinostoma caproni TaxID=27848 RepID=A0A183AM79_9TREM|nr:unnamed protein product [Echinostoma caproni]
MVRGSSLATPLWWYRAPDRSRSPDPRQFQPRRTYVAYRPPSTGRDSSYEDYGHESRPPRFRHSRSHSRSRGLSRHGCETAGREYDMSQPSTRPPRDASPRRNGTRRHYRDEPERPRDSPPRRPLKRDRPTDERHPRPELSMSDNRHGRPYRPRERAHGDHFPSPEHAVQPIHESRRERSPERRPRHREPIRPMDSERRMARADKPRISPSRCAPRQSTRSDHRSREERDTSRKQHDSEENNKPERHPRRPSMNEDRLSTEHNTPTESSSGTTNAVSTAGSRAHKRSTASRSPRSSKRDSGSGKSHAPTAPTSSVSSKLRPVQEHLDQLQFEAVSDTELETMLTPAVFLTTTSPAKDTAGTELTDLASGEQGLVESGQNKENKETLPTSSDAAADSAVTTDASKTNETKGEESTALVLDALDKISSQLKQKLSGPETWDIGAGSESEIEDDVGLGGLDLFADQSVIGLTTSKTGWSTRSRQLTASLNAPWQRLVESATKELAPMDLAMENKMNDRDFIQPAVCVGTPLNPQGSSFPRRLVSLQRRASGAACLSQIGISSRYLGSELRTELIHLVQEQLSTEDADKSELTSSAPEIDTIGSHTVAWMDRTRDIFASCGQDLPRLWFESAINFGILSGKSDHTVRRLLLQGTT